MQEFMADMIKILSGFIKAFYILPYLGKGEGKDILDYFA